MAKKKASKSSLHQEVNKTWGWVVIALGVAVFIAVVVWSYYSM